MAQETPLGARGRLGGRRMLVATLLVGLLALVGSGIGGFLVLSSLAYGPGAPGCATVNAKCMPVNLDVMVKQLHASGFSCDRDSATFLRCQLTVGLTRYDAYLAAPPDTNDLVGYEIIVTYEGDSPPGKGPMACLQWFASVPFAGDKPAAAATTSWLVKQVKRHGHEKATINGYRYELDASEPRGIMLRVEGGS